MTRRGGPGEMGGRQDRQRTGRRVGVTRAVDSRRSLWERCPRRFFSRPDGAVAAQPTHRRPSCTDHGQGEDSAGMSLSTGRVKSAGARLVVALAVAVTAAACCGTTGPPGMRIDSLHALLPSSTEAPTTSAPAAPAPAPQAPPQPSPTRAPRRKRRPRSRRRSCRSPPTRRRGPGTHAGATAQRSRGPRAARHR